MASTMRMEEVEMTLETMLNLACGTPEVGAVNFNYLFEVIHEILQHLGITKKTARVTQEVDYRALEEQWATKIAAAAVKQIPTPQPIVMPSATAAVQPALVQMSQPQKPDLKTSAEKVAAKASEKDVTPPVADVETTKETNKDSAPIEEPAATAAAPAASVSNTVESKPSTQAAGPSPQTSLPEKPLPSVHSKERKFSHAAVVPQPPSRRQSLVHSRRSSFGVATPSGHRMPLKPVDVPNQDIALINQSLERKDSKTPAGDMWHILNINRRLEAAEATIQGMTNLIDTISSDVEEIKNSPSSVADPIVKESVPESSGISKPEQEVVKKLAAKVKGLDGMFNELEKKVNKCAEKDELQVFCDHKKVKAMVDEGLANFNPLEPPPPPPQQVIVQQTVVETVKKESAPLLKQRDSQASRTRIAFQDMSSKLGDLETELLKTNGRVNVIERNMELKLEMADIEDKVGRKELDDKLASVLEKIKLQSDQVAVIEKNMKSLKDDIRSLSSQNGDHLNQQKNIANSIRKLERDIEDITDSFHRCQNEMMKLQPSNKSSVDDAVITKIRGSIFDLQEQQSKLQEQLDILQQDSKNKNQKITETFTEIGKLQKEKVDEAFVKKQVEDKASVRLVEDKVSRDQFDACIGGLDQNFQQVMQKLDNQESTVQKALDSLHQHISDKMDRNEATNIRQYIDTRFKTYKPKLPEQVQKDESAAGSRKRVIPNFNCISCDRPVDLLPDPKGPALPYCGPLPGAKTIRQYATFDLHEIRARMQQSWLHGNKDRYDAAQEREKLQKELLRLCGVRDLDDLAAQTNRACGGVHTLVESNRRTPGKQPFYREESSPYPPAERQLFETDVLGRDGHIYKGRIETNSPLPEVVKKTDMKQSVPPNTSQQANRPESPILARPSMQKSRSGIQTGITAALPKLTAVESNS